MKAKLIELILIVVHTLQINLDWMTWNLFLAFIPLALSIWLFRTRRGRSWVWWLGFLAFYAFLPNAPYMLTDIIHLVDNIRAIQSIWLITLILIPLYVFVILSAFESYVISLINLGYYLHRISKSRWIWRFELITHGLCAIGIYWGRFLRFNSWDFITQPDAVLTRGVENILGKQPLAIIVISFFILTSLYLLMKQITLSFARQRHKGIGVSSGRVNSDSFNT